jgi:hypothetical protein
MRDICITYEYFPGTGFLKYAATVFLKSFSNEEMSDLYIVSHENTTQRRFDIRPVIVTVNPYLTYDELITTIRYEMCQGMGVKGPKIDTKNSKHIIFDDDDISVVSVPSNDRNFKVSEKTFSRNIKKIKFMNYNNSDENSDLKNIIFIAYKGRKSKSELIYGACIYDFKEDVDENEYKKIALERLDKCPVHMKISDKFKYQLGKKSTHNEDVMFEIIDNIFNQRYEYF